MQAAPDSKSWRSGVMTLVARNYYEQLGNARSSSKIVLSKIAGASPKFIRERTVRREITYSPFAVFQLLNFLNHEFEWQSSCRKVTSSGLCDFILTAAVPQHTPVLPHMLKRPSKSSFPLRLGAGLKGLIVLWLEQITDLAMKLGI